jgi:hypothetical protein
MIILTPVRIQATDSGLIVELPAEHRVDTHGYMLTVNEALELGQQLIVKAAEILASRGHDG